MGIVIFLDEVTHVRGEACQGVLLVVSDQLQQLIERCDKGIVVVFRFRGIEQGGHEAPVGGRLLDDAGHVHSFQVPLSYSVWSRTCWI